MKNLKKMAFGILATTAILTYSCTKPKPAPVNNSNSGNTNKDAPSLIVRQPAVDTTVGISASLTVKIIATASSTANIDSILGSDGLGHKVRIVALNIKNGGKVSYTKDTLVYDYYQLPTSATGTTVNLTYTVYGQGKSNTITR